MVVRKRSRGNLVNRWLENLHKIHGALIPRGDEPVNLDGFTEGSEFGIVLGSKFETMLQVAIGGSERVLARRGKLLRCINHLNRSFLKLDRVATGGDRNAYKPLCQIYIAIMIDPDFRDDVAGLARTHKPIANFHSCSHGVAPMRRPEIVQPGVERRTRTACLIVSEHPQHVHPPRTIIAIAKCMSY